MVCENLTNLKSSKVVLKRAGEGGTRGLLFASKLSSFQELGKKDNFSDLKNLCHSVIIMKAYSY